jgi:hypothetical protein
MNKQTWIACGVLAVMSAGAWYMLSRKPERGIVRLSYAHVDMKQADRISIESHENNQPAKVVLKRQKDTWLLENGRLADAAAVQRMLDAVGKIQTSDQITSDASRDAEFHTDDAQGVKVHVWKGKEALASFVVGKDEGRFTALKAQGHVFRMPYFSQKVFAKPVQEWAERKIFQTAESDIEKVEITLLGQPFVALVRKDNAWEYENPALLPQGFRYSAGAAGAWVQSLLNLRAREVLHADPGTATTGLTGSVHRLKVYGKAGTPSVELLLGMPKDNDTSYAQVNTREDVFALATSNVGFVSNIPNAFRDMGVMSFASNKVKEATLQQGARKTTFVKNAEGHWQVKGAVPAGFALQESEVNRWLDGVATLRGMGVAASEVTLAQAGLNNSTSQVVCVLEDGSKVAAQFGHTVKVGSSDAVYAKGNADNAVYHVPVYLRDSLLRTLDSFKQASEESMMQGLDPSALQNLPPEVRNNLLKQLRENQQKEAMARQMGQ